VEIKFFAPIKNAAGFGPDETSQCSDCVNISDNSNRFTFGTFHLVLQLLL